MIDILLTGVGGQGTVLAAKVLAQAAQNKGWQVRTAETIGMAQRGGTVTSHMRMGNEGEPVHAPLVARGRADAIIAFEPGEAARALPYLAPEGSLITASTVVYPVTASLASVAYSSDEVIANLARACDRLHVVDDAAILAQIGGSRRSLNVVLLASAVAWGSIPLSVDELKDAITVCVKPRFVPMNLAAVDAVLAVR